MELKRPAILCLAVLTVVSSQLPVDAEKTPREAKGKKQAVSSKLVWQNNYSQTLRSAASQRKWVLIDVYTQWCGPCKMLDANVFSQPKVAQFLNNSFVCMKADAERGDGLTVAQKFHVEGYPCTLILKPNGQEKGRIIGYLDPSSYIREVSRKVQGR